MKDKKVSVIVPVYNVESYIEECMQSLTEQTYNNLEIIVIDDGSQDKSVDICRTFAKCDSRIEIIRQENAGVSIARNVGIKKASGEYITFVDADDWVDRAYVETLVKSMNDDVDIVLCNSPKNTYKVPKMANNQTDKVFLFTEFPNTWGKLIRRSSITENFAENVCYGEDLLFYLMNLKNVNKVVLLEYAGYHYRIRVGSITAKDKKEKHSLKEFENKYTILEGALLCEERNDFEGEAKKIVRSNYFYVLTMLILLRYRLSIDGVEIEKQKFELIRKMLKLYLSDFVDVTLVQRKNIKRFLFGYVLYLAPNFGARIADILLEKKE